MKKILLIFSGVIFSNLLHAQNMPNDCVNAIVVCGNKNFITNASGVGITSEVNHCGGAEHNSLWIKINIVQAGTLGFDLIPNDPDIAVDYDFWVFGPNKDCSDLGTSIRCATVNPLPPPSGVGAVNNHTGMNGTSPYTVIGPGATNPGKKDGYVRWLDVMVGQTYYIAIDRPVGKGGFQLNWTGSATVGSGAFPSPPIADQIPDLVSCSVAGDSGEFNLAVARPKINADWTSNVVTFHKSFADATDGVSALPSMYTNTSNPQLIYSKVKSITGGCSSIISFNLKVSAIPAVSGSSFVCVDKASQWTGSGMPSSIAPWYSSDTAVATVSDTGVVTGVGVGTANIKYTNNDGCTSAESPVTVSSCLGVSEHGISDLRFFPNPVTDFLTITSLDQISRVEVYNLLGQELRVVDQDSTVVQIDLKGLPSSTYLIRVYSEEGIQAFTVIKK